MIRAVNAANSLGSLIMLLLYVAISQFWVYFQLAICLPAIGNVSPSLWMQLVYLLVIARLCVCCVISLEVAVSVAFQLSNSTPWCVCTLLLSMDMGYARYIVMTATHIQELCMCVY